MRTDLEKNLEKHKNRLNKWHETQKIIDSNATQKPNKSVLLILGLISLIVITSFVIGALLSYDKIDIELSLDTIIKPNVEITEEVKVENITISHPITNVTLDYEYKIRRKQ